MISPETMDLMIKTGITPVNYFKELSKSLADAFGNIAVRQSGGQTPSNRIQMILMKIGYYLLDVSSIKTYDDVLKFDINLQTYMSEVYRRASIDALASIGKLAVSSEQNDGQRKAFDKIVSMFGKDPTTINWDDLNLVETMVGKMYCFTHIVKAQQVDDGNCYFVLNFQFRYGQYYTNHPTTVLRDQGFTFLFQLCNKIPIFLSLTPLESYCKGSQDFGDLMTAVGKINVEELENVLNLATQQKFVFKLDGSLVRFSVSLVQTHYGSLTFISGSTAGTSFYSFRVCDSIDTESVEQYINEIMHEWYANEEVDTISGLREAYSAFVLDVIEDIDGDETFTRTCYGEIVHPGKMPGSVSSVKKDCFFEFHDSQQIERYLQMGFSIPDNQTFQKLNIVEMSETQKQAIAKIIPVKFIDGVKITISDILNICYAICVIYNFRAKPGREKIEYNALLLKSFSHIIHEFKCNFQSGYLLQQVNILSNTLIYRITPEEILMPEGLISFYYHDDNYCTAIKWKLDLWTYMHGATTANQLKDVIEIFRYFKNLCEVSIILDISENDHLHSTTNAIKKRFKSFMRRTGSFRMCYEYLEDLSERVDGDEGIAITFILNGFRSLQGSIRKDFKNDTEISNDLNVIVQGGSDATRIINKHLNLNNITVSDKTMTITLNGQSYHVKKTIPENMNTILENWRTNSTNLLELSAYMETLSKPNSHPTQLFKDFYAKKLDSMFNDFFGAWIKRLTQNKHEFVSVLCDWDGSLNAHPRTLQTLTTLSTLSGMKIPILTGNPDLKMITDFLGSTSERFEIFSIGKMLLEEMNLHSFLITAMTAQIKAWILKNLEMQNVNICLFDDSNAVVDACGRIGCTMTNIIKADGDEANILIKIGTWFIDAIERNYSDHSLIETGLLWFNAVSLTFDRVDGLINKIDEVVKSLSDPISCLNHIRMKNGGKSLFDLVPNKNTHQIPLVVLSGSQGSGKSFSARYLATLFETGSSHAFLQKLFGSPRPILMLCQDPYNVGGWTLAKQKAGEALLLRVIKVFRDYEHTQLSCAIFMTCCSQPKGLGQITYSLETDSVQKCSTEKLNADVKQGRRRNIFPTSNACCLECDGDVGIPSELKGKVVFASFEVPRDFCISVLEIVRSVGLETFDNHDFQYSERRGVPHFATANSDTDKQLFPRYLSGTVATLMGVVKVITLYGCTSMMLWEFGKGFISHTTMETSFASGAQIHELRLDEIIYGFVKQYHQPMKMITEEIIPGITLEYVHLTGQTIKMTPYYHLRNQKI